MTTTAKKEPTRLEKLIALAERIRLEEIGERDFEYRDHLKALRLRVLAEIKLETQRTGQTDQISEV